MAYGLRVGDYAEAQFDITTESGKTYHPIFRFETCASGAFEYGNKTAVIVSRDGVKASDCFDTRYYGGSLVDLVFAYLDEHWEGCENLVITYKPVNRKEG